MKRLLLLVSIAGIAALGLVVGCGTDCPGSNGSGACFENNGSTQDPECSFNSGNATSCDNGRSPGHCSATGLVGCCVTTSTVLSCTETGAACYYANDTATMTAQSACTGGVAGTNLKWVTTPP